MNTQSPDAPGSGGEAQGLKKLVSRVRSRLKGDPSSKSESRSQRASTATVPVASSAVAEYRREAGPAPPASPPAFEPIPLDVDTDPESTLPTSIPVPPPLFRSSSADVSRVQQLASRYDITLDLDPTKWETPVGEGNRVEKPIRMRIHRTCHRCGTTFGANRTCATCRHRRCDDCPRYPRKKSATETEKEKEQSRSFGTQTMPMPGRTGTGRTVVGAGVSAAHANALAAERLKRKFPLSIPSKTGGQDLVYKKVVQRVRRNCHKCRTVYRPGERTCGGCGHGRCVRCPRDPPKFKKFPDGYPGDAFGSSDEEEAVSSYPAAGTMASSMASDSRWDVDRNRERLYHPTQRPMHDCPRRPVRFACHRCQTIFSPPPPSHPQLRPLPQPQLQQQPGQSGQSGQLGSGSGQPPPLTCSKCNHTKCNDCKRVIPRKVRGDPEPDPEVVRSVEEKLRGLGILRDRDRERNQLAEQEEKGVLEELGERGKGLGGDGDEQTQRLGGWRGG